jgi:hypothetical protein
MGDRVDEVSGVASRFRALGTISSRSGSESSDKSDDSTASGGAEVNAIKTPQILVTGRADLEQNNGNPSYNITVRFNVASDTRGSTNLPDGSQGDHTTSYTAIIRALLGCADENTIESTIDDIKTFADSVLMKEGDGIREFGRIQKPVILIEGKERKQIKGILEAASGAGDLGSGISELVNVALKHSKVSLLANYLADLTSCLLTEMQKEDLTTFYSKGRLKKAAGDSEKGAADALVMLNQLCKLCELEDKKFEEKFPSFRRGLDTLSEQDKKSGETKEDRIIRYGLSRFYPSGGSNTDGGAEAKTIISLLDNKDNSSTAKRTECLIALRDKLLQKTDMIAQFQGDLLDYRREIIFDLKEANEDHLKEYFPEDINVYTKTNIVITKDGKAREVPVITVTRTDKEDLVKILSRHLEVMATAFPSLHNTMKAQVKDGKSLKEIITEKFLKTEVLEKQGWKDFMYEDLATGQNVKLNETHLKQEIEAFNKSKDSGKGQSR